jgi:hypothetical protein
MADLRTDAPAVRHDFARWRFVRGLAMVDHEK